MNPCKFYKCLADDTRLHSLMLISRVEEACVCELMAAMELDQPKMSRHLAELRKCGILQDERRGKWVYYRLHPDLPSWAVKVIQDTAEHNPDYYQAALKRILPNPTADNICC
ncbi:metalloregulator ArsR/SmtB family transcription factor [Marinomonas sp. A79]|uniref:Metalloregulator ArsR/SmtB family transcription factor n=1 Tax=Marinomonas vulgaris TaxID=2823372 RepID=A0ABS5H9G6_9GAMM|nr:metalloregulator ArsR/SmtB family transcription factor [Marinomonas vulgaris]MBR7887619.1 metalloregulator ArsR/SmtB family transcription factor [Marinomonas vulgaris]